jgi:acyl-CoA oxidase
MHLVFSGKSVVKHLGWYLYSGALSVAAGSKLSRQINEIITKLSPHSLEIVNAFGVPEEQIKAPMYTGYQEYYKDDVKNGEHTQPQLHSAKF